MKIKYVKCSNCSFVFDSTLEECPKCKQIISINENFSKSEEDNNLFNICD